MSAESLHARCARCANRCRVCLTLGSEGTVTEARKQVLGRITSYERCPNLDKDVGLTVAELDASGFVIR